jgi:hypothetical protein
MTMRVSIVAAAIMAVFCAHGASAAVVIKTTDGDGAEAKSQTLILDADKMRMSTNRGAMLYRADTGKMIMINDTSRSYTEISADSLQKMRSAMQAQMQQRLAAMPEEQRKKIEAMMAAHGAPTGPAMPAEAPRVVTYQKSGEARKVGQWICIPYTMLVNDKPQSDLCLAKMSDVGLTREDLKSFVNLTATMNKQMGGTGANRPALATADFEALANAVGYDAFPVETSHVTASGQTQIETTVQSIEHKDVPADTFEVPADYTKRDAMSHMGGGQ